MKAGIIYKFLTMQMQGNPGSTIQVFMAKIISIAAYKEHSALRAGYSYWRTLFGEDFADDARLVDLNALVLARLSEPGDDSSRALFSLIIGFLGYGETDTFESLDSKVQSRVLDIHLFLSDHIRFEMMFRLGWLDRLCGNQFTLFEMVTAFDRVRKICADQPPSLAKDHKDYETYSKLFERDQQVFIRHKVASALEAFKKKYHIT